MYVKTLVLIGEIPTIVFFTPTKKSLMGICYWTVLSLEESDKNRQFMCIDQSKGPISQTELNASYAKAANR